MLREPPDERRGSARTSVRFDAARAGTETVTWASVHTGEMDEGPYCSTTVDELRLLALTGKRRRGRGALRSK